MKFSLSTNWCNRRLLTGEEIADKALELGFGEIELGYHTTPQQVHGFKRRLDRMPIGSVHAFCPVPLSAPDGYPELYPLASFDDESSKMADVMVRRNVAFAAEMGADTIVLHAGRVLCPSLFTVFRKRKRYKRGAKLLDLFHKALDALVTDLERHKIVLALENLPYFEGFPDESELQVVLSWGLGDWVKGWYDTGHARVRQQNGWCDLNAMPQPADYIGLHLNDVVDKQDDHLAPSFGKVDFASLKDFASHMRHLVFEPNATVDEADLKKGLSYIRQIW